MRLRSGRLFPPPENSRAPARRARGQTPSRAVRHTALESSEQLPPVASRPRNIAGRKTSTRQARVTPPGQQEETPVQQSQPTDPHTEQQHGSGVQEAAPTQGSLNPEVDNPQVINELDAYNDEITSSANSPRFDRRHQAEQSKERSETTLSPNALQLRAWLASALPQEELLDPFEPMPPGQGPSGIRRQNNPKRQSTAMSDDPVGLSEVFEGDGSSVTGTMLPVSQRQRESNTPENKQYILQNCTPPIVFRYGAPLRPGDVPPKPVLEVSERLDLFKRIKDRPFIPECLRAKLYRREQENGDQGLQIADHKPAATQRMGEAEVQKCWTRIEKLAIKCQKAIESRHPETTWLMHISELFNNEPLTEIFTGKPTHEHIGLAPITDTNPSLQHMPRDGNGPVPGARVDLLLYMEDTHPEFQLFKSSPIPGLPHLRFHLSPFEVASIEEPPLLLIGSKIGTGSLADAENELALAAAAWLQAIDRQLFDGKGLQRLRTLAVPGQAEQSGTQAGGNDEQAEAELMQRCLVVLTVRIMEGVWQWGVAYVDGMGKIIMWNRPGPDIGDMTTPEGICHIAAWIEAFKTWLGDRWIPAISTAIKKQTEKQQARLA